MNLSTNMKKLLGIIRKHLENSGLIDQEAL